ncbi:lipid droplet-associated protein [Nocardia yamanashiensis]|uniref:lipid droplet-associated protein n=1 Tax=Nocardia yamanashiensis TaxID=209247 RepID=UPI001E382B58|nr:lipid droplet-associated protein [Nocardia yamanashiensis]UGT38723.1 lipid droplet-associated protein [Nocardia yamanashiensis]
MFRPPFLARVAAGAAVYALEETRRLPTTAINFPITAISQMLQTTMHFQQFVTSLALKGDAVFDRLVNQPEEQPAWATFDEDEDLEQTPSFGSESVRKSRFDLFTPEESAPAEPVAEITEPVVTESAAAETESAPASDPIVAEPEPVAAESAAQEAAEPEAAETEAPATASVASTNGHNGSAPAAPEVASRFNYDEMTIAQLRARLRQLSVEDLSTLLAYEQGTRDRAPFVTMLTNRIATVQAK